MSWSVAGKKRRMSDSGDCLLTQDWPKSPRSRLRTHSPYWTQQRPVESQVRRSAASACGRRLAAELDRGRIAGDQPDQREDDDRDHEQDGDELDQALGEVALHEAWEAGRWESGPHAPQVAQPSSISRRLGRPRALTWRFLTLPVAPHRTGHVCWRMAGTSVITSCAISL